MSYKSELQKMFDLQKFGIKLGLDSMKSILARLGQPQAGRRFVHLAGTNGKGSVGAMLQSVLSAAGYGVGFYTSPHLVTFRERIKIGAEMISEKDVLSLSARVWAATDPQSAPTFFEFVTAMAFLYFAEKKTDLDIIEAGLGGRLDSTNVIENPLTTAITNIALEHTEHLGATLALIAGEKAGIIKTGVPLVTGALPPEAAEVIWRRALELKSPALIPGRDFTVETTSFDRQGRPTINYRSGALVLESLELGLAGPHQADNAAVAITICEQLAGRGFPLEEKHLRAGLRQVAWPGRAETFPAGAWPPQGSPARAPLLLDGAHNPAGAEALARHLQTMTYDQLHLIVGVMADKDITGVLGPILPMADHLYLTRPAFSRAASPGLLWDRITAAFGPPRVPTTLHPTIPEAFQAAAAEARESDLVLLSGSLFTVGEGRAWLQGLSEVESN
ncbi:MAG: bifunctional folylpolyglutamate synthase/dihydrofolate synthase [Candidatus Adiutrix sp.]|jgi:dihydrofolate synthase/folylpolyglutamate synthase|nr:bifunctional folylpolyglutamate synthase/dihydrofolate synthase [Candidatus Adiutrix sp.]